MLQRKGSISPKEKKVSEDSRRSQQERPQLAGGPISWWSWRPGIRPRNALLIGSLLSVVAVLLLATGSVTLALGILDSFSPPLQVAGSVYSHAVNQLNGRPCLIVHVHRAGFPAVVAPTVSNALFHSIHDGNTLLLDYSPRLRVLYAIDSAGQRFPLPGGSAVLDFIGERGLLLVGGVLLPYPALLMSWGWRDLLAARRRAKSTFLSGTVVALRVSTPGGPGRPGLIPRAARPWHGVAVQSTDGEVTTFALRQERYVSLHEGDSVRITYSPCVHFVYALEQVSE
jgi:hypothetical protein